MSKDVDCMLCEDMFFWVVKFCIGWEGIFGFDILFFGVYI